MLSLERKRVLSGSDQEEMYTSKRIHFEVLFRGNTFGFS
uniref:Uncharacterized protein n=1 Tax=Aegilops tauschii subsp. strangulata TaxID=200361 RepID=A0A453L298_AEGTS